MSIWSYAQGSTVGLTVERGSSYRPVILPRQTSCSTPQMPLHKFGKAKIWFLQKQSIYLNVYIQFFDVRENIPVTWKIVTWTSFTGFYCWWGRGGRGVVFCYSLFDKYLFIILILKTVLNLNQATVNEFPVGSWYFTNYLYVWLCTKYG